MMDIVTLISLNGRDITIEHDPELNSVNLQIHHDAGGISVRNHYVFSENETEFLWTFLNRFYTPPKPPKKEKKGKGKKGKK